MNQSCKSYIDRVTLPCKQCGHKHHVPLYANVGNYTPYKWCCIMCSYWNTYKRFYGCQNMTEALQQNFYAEM